jgi:Zn-dependent protease with chaperone function
MFARMIASGICVRRCTSPILAAMAALVAVACAGPITQVGSVSSEDVQAEQQQQLRLAAELEMANQQRVDRLAAPLLRAAAPLCGNPASVKRSLRGATTIVPATEGVCAYQVIVPRADELNAAADGSKIYVATAMLRFASDDELSVVLAHEIAHNAMRHRDAQMKNALGGALLGAMADIAVAVATRGKTSTNMTESGAQAGAQAFSQDFEREADYVGLYILAWAGQPTTTAAGFWRRMAVEHPSGIVFAMTHPTTAERFVRLEQWSREVNLKIASGDAFGPEMKDQRLRVASRAISPHQQKTPGGDVVLATRDTTRTPALGTDAGPRTAFAPSPPSSTGVRTMVAKEKPGADRTAEVTAHPLEDERFARATIGAPRSETDRAAAVPEYERGIELLGSHYWGEAKTHFKRALMLDGSVAAYHAAIGEVFIVEEDWAAAAAEFTAALLLDVDNADYRAKLKEARARN